MGGGGAEYKESKSKIKKNLFFVGVGAARVSDFFIQRIQI